MKLNPGLYTAIWFTLASALPQFGISSPQSKSSSPATPAQIATPAESRLTPPARDDLFTDSVFYEYGFEEGWNNWSRKALTDAEVYWHPTAENAYQDGSSWWCSDENLNGYTNRWLQFLMTPVLNLNGYENLTLRFKLYYSCENPEVDPPSNGGYNEYDAWDGCNLWISTDGGEMWQILTPTSPEYDYQSLFSYGYEWGMMPDIPGWCGLRKEWLDVEFDLSDFARDDIRIRWAFCSDPAWNTSNDATAIGMLVDEMEISSGDAILWSNDGSEVGDMEAVTGQSVMWELTTADAYEGTRSAHCRIMATMDNTLISPPLIIPSAPWDRARFDFWVRMDSRIPDPNGDQTPDDLFWVEVEQGDRWTQMVYDYGRDDEWCDNWQYYGPDCTIARNADEWKRMLDLTDFAGDTVRLRWRFINDQIMDVNRVQDEGTGLFIDDFRLLGLKRVTLVFVPDDVPTIQAALNGATDGDTILVRPGVYHDSLNFAGHNVVLASLFLLENDQAYIDSTILDGDSAKVVVTFDHQETEQALLTGFTIRNGRSAQGGGIQCNGASPRISHCRIIRNSTTGQGGGIYCRSSAAPTLDHCIIVGNRTTLGGGGIALRTARISLDHCTIFGNISTNRDSTLGGAMFLRDASATLTNTIVWGNSPREISIYGEGDPSFLDIFYANLAGGQDGIVTNDNGGVNWGSGNLTDDPLFTDPDQRDLSLQPGSPCIDAGSPDYPADPDLTRTDMGIIWFNHGERAIACDPQLITFDPIMPDSVAEHSVNISNTAGGYLRVYSSNIVGADTVFAVTAGSGMFVVGPGDPPHLLTVRFNPRVVGDYQATLKIESNDPNSPSLEIPITGQALGVKQDSELPVGFTLLPIRPNPFNGEAIVRYSLPKSGAVRLEVYDLHGRRVRTVANGNQSAGWHTLTFSGSDLADGIYMVRLTAGGNVLLGKAVLIK